MKGLFGSIGVHGHLEDDPQGVWVRTGLQAVRTGFIVNAEYLSTLFSILNEGFRSVPLWVRQEVTTADLHNLVAVLDQRVRDNLVEGLPLV